MNIQRKLLDSLPLEIIINNIIPFTYETKNQYHLQDISSFYTDFRLMQNMFYEFNDVIILNDLIRFCNNFISPIYDIEKRYDAILRRHFSFKNKTKEELRHFVFYDFHKNILINPDRKIKFLFGLLTPIERTRFFNHFYINED